MKKLLGIVVLGLLWFNTSFADNYKIGQKIENEFRFTKKIKFPLESGTWTVIEKSGWFHGDIRVRMIGIVLTENDEIISFREFQEGNLGGSFQSELNTALYNYFYLDKYDGCYQRTEYTLVKKYSKGTSTNCLVVDHMDVNKELYTPDDSKRTHERTKYRKWINDYNIKVPDIMLGSWHAYFSRTVSGNLYTIGYYDNPKYFNGPQHKFSTEDTSEYHPSNINKHPKFKKYMNDFIKISAARHIEFEKIVSAKTHHKLDFSSIGIESKNKTKVKTLKNSNMIKQLNNLKKLLDEGVITQDEFTKAKKKILD